MKSIWTFEDLKSFGKKLQHISKRRQGPWGYRAGWCVQGCLENFQNEHPFWNMNTSLNWYIFIFICISPPTWMSKKHHFYFKSWCGDKNTNQMLIYVLDCWRHKTKLWYSVANVFIVMVAMITVAITIVFQASSLQSWLSPSPTGRTPWWSCSGW